MGAPRRAPYGPSRGPSGAGAGLRGACVLLLALGAIVACRSSAEQQSSGGAPGALEPAAGSASAPRHRVPVRASAAQATPPTLHQHERSCLGTRCTLLAWHAEAALVREAFDAALREVERLDRMMTTWLPDSDVSRINAAAGSGQPVPIAEETLTVLQRSRWVAELTGGAFDITVGAFKGLWKFDQDNDGSLPEPAAVAARLPLVSYRDLIVDAAAPAARLRRKGQRITLGGIAKGFIVDRAVDVMRKRGVFDFVFRAGGDLFASGRRGDRPWRVGIQDPRSPSKAPEEERSFALLPLENSAFNTSGDYERFVMRRGKRYHHILDPATGQPVTHTRSVTVLAPTALLADTLDTALFVVGVERGMPIVESLADVEAVFVDDKSQVFVSSGLQPRLKVLRPPTDAP